MLDLFLFYCVCVFFFFFFEVHSDGICSDTIWNVFCILGKNVFFAGYLERKKHSIVLFTIHFNMSRCNFFNEKDTSF